MYCTGYYSILGRPILPDQISARLVCHLEKQVPISLFPDSNPYSLSTLNPNRTPAEPSRLGPGSRHSEPWHRGGVPTWPHGPCTGHSKPEALTLITSKASQSRRPECHCSYHEPWRCQSQNPAKASRRRKNPKPEASEP